MAPGLARRSGIFSARTCAHEGFPPSLPESWHLVATVAVARGVRACATDSVQRSSTPYGYDQGIHRGAFQNQLRLGRIGRFQNLKSSRPQPLSVCRTDDCIFFHDQDGRFFRKGHRSTTRLKQEDPGRGRSSEFIAVPLTSCVIERFSIFGNAYCTQMHC